MLQPLLAASVGATPTFRRIGTEPALDGHIRVSGVGSGLFDPGRIAHWLADERSPLIAPRAGGSCPGNIYNPTVVRNGGAWNVYFGGWDGVSSCHDSVSVTVTEDNFASFGAHVPMIATGTCQHVNNPSATKINASAWVMVYTQDNSNINKPGLSVATSGIDWKPSKGGGDFLSMEGYPFDWGSATTGADVNGGNVLLYDRANDTYHLWFTDFKQLNNHSVFHATARGGSLGSFEYRGIAVAEAGRIVNDMKNIGGLYVAAMHDNGPQTFVSISSDPASFPAPRLLFPHEGAADLHIVSVALVVDSHSERLLGALYGAGAVPTLDHNRIFGRWLQRKVLFVGDDSTVLWGLNATAHGPDAQRLTSNRAVPPGTPPVGKFHLYDSDFVDLDQRGTLLHVSEDVSVAPGDLWEYA